MTLLWTDVDIETPRLRLTQLGDEDAPALSVLRSHPDVNRFLDREPQGERDTRDFIAKIRKTVSEGKSFYYAIRLREEGRLAGTVCVWNFNDERTTAELGYELHPDFQGRGLGGEAVNAVIAHLKLRTSLKSLDAFTHPGNERSSRLLLTAGFMLQSHRSSAAHTSDLVYTLRL